MKCNCLGPRVPGTPKALPNYWWLGSMKTTSNINKTQSFKIIENPITKTVQKIIQTFQMDNQKDNTRTNLQKEGHKNLTSVYQQPTTSKHKSSHRLNVFFYSSSSKYNYVHFIPIKDNLHTPNFAISGMTGNKEAFTIHSLKSFLIEWTIKNYSSEQLWLSKTLNLYFDR